MNHLKLPFRIYGALLIVTLTSSDRVLAQGLIQKLPEDGEWAKYEMKGLAKEPDGTVVTMNGTVTVSSVGTEEVDGKKCRWIEFVIDGERSGERSVIVDKLLIPEEHLDADKEPLGNVVRAWHMHSMLGDAPQKVKVNKDEQKRGSLLGVFLHGPFDSSIELEPIAISSKLGELECDGLSAFERVELGGGTIMEFHYTIRTHDMAPFGVISWESSFKVDADGKFLGTMQTNLTLVDTGRDAESKFPDAK